MYKCTSSLLSKKISYLQCIVPDIDFHVFSVCVRACSCCVCVCVCGCVVVWLCVSVPVCFCWAEASREDICFGVVVQAQSMEVDFIPVFVLKSTIFVTTCMCACVRACSNVSV